MKLAEVTLVTRDVEPGWPLVDDDVPLGKKYIVDLDRVTGGSIINQLTGQEKPVALIWVVSPGVPGYLPAMAFGMSDLGPSDRTFPSLPMTHVEFVCRLAAGAETCSYLCQQQGGSYFCAKGTPYEAVLKKKRRYSLMKSKGDWCSGPPDFTVHS